jgi:hypothetical protein
MPLPCSPLGSTRSLLHRHACMTPKREERRRMSEVGESGRGQKEGKQSALQCQKGVEGVGRIHGMVIGMKPA